MRWTHSVYPSKFGRFLLGIPMLLMLACGGSNNGNNGNDTGNNTMDGSLDTNNPNDTNSNSETATMDTNPNSESSTSETSTMDTPIVPGDVVLVDQDGTTVACRVTACDGHVLECGDCIDNDNDGLFDPSDPECLGPCDNTEGPYLLTGVGGETGGPCQSDCYFDFGNGPGNDDCQWDHRCDTLSVAPNFYPEGPSCAYDSSRVGSRDCPTDQSNQCHDYCTPLTPNGCDCFGCCTFPQLAGMGPNGGPGYIWLGSRDSSNNGSCTFDQITNPAACHPCTPVGNCLNECGQCEVCIGRPVPPPECFPTPQPDGGLDVTPTDGPPSDTPTDRPMSEPPPPRCPSSFQPCGLPGDEMCPLDYYCITGCCIEAPG